MTRTLFCPRCNKNREFYDVREWDKVAGKYWTIIRCQKCAFNADIEEGIHETRVTKTVYPKPECDSRDSDGGWHV